MDSHLDSVFPLQLTLEDLIFDTHEGQATWLQIVGLATDGNAVLVICDGDPVPLRLPVSRPVRVRRREGSDQPGSSGEGDSDVVADYYSGDLESAVAAHAQPHLTPIRSGKGLSEPHYDGVYGGDLDHIMDALGGKHRSDRAALEARAAAFLRRMREPEAEDIDEDSAKDDNEQVNERMAGWYAGDLGSIVPRRRDS